MIARDQLDSAVTAGILSAAQADRLVAHLDPATQDPEEVRFARGFHDVFITLGIAILLLGAYQGLAGVLPAGLGALGPAPFVAVLVWALAEIFVARRKLALPAVLLALAFPPLVVQAVLNFYSPGSGLIAPELLGAPGTPYDLLAAVGAGFIATLAFQARFRVPITYAATAAMATALAVTAVEWAAPGTVENNFALLTLIAGLAIFAAAMVFDARDVQRTSLNTDKAFWLHLLAAPLIVHSSLSLLGGAEGGRSVLIIAVICLLALVALIVDRRAILVSGLAYLGIAIGTLLKGAALDEATLFAGTLVILGLIVLMLGSGWGTLRALLMRPLMGTALSAYLPAALPAASSAARN